MLVPWCTARSDTNLKWQKLNTLFSNQFVSIGVAAGEALIVFPWWFAVIHLTAIIGLRFEDPETAFSNQYEVTNTE